MVWLKQKLWRNVLLICSFPVLFAYLIKTTHSRTYTSYRQYENENMLPQQSTGELSLLTYNVAGLPEFISAAKTPRVPSMKAIAKKINEYDIVNVQEDFQYHKELYSTANLHPYRTEQKVAIPYGDGLNTLSKYPIREIRRIPWKDCNGSDCLAAKGFSLTRIEIAKDVLIDVYNVHTTAQDDPAAAMARQKNFNQLAAYMDVHSANHALVVMGDFNAHFTASWDNIRNFAHQTALQDVWTTLIKQGELPAARTDFVVADKLSLNDSTESIDKIFFRNSSDIVFQPLHYKVESAYFTDSTGTALSDHYAISSRIKWVYRSRN